MYKQIFTKPFLSDVKAVKKDKNLINRLHGKIDAILENPEHYKPLKHKLKGKRRAHIGHYVVLFEVKGSEVIFHRFKHHDDVYK